MPLPTGITPQGSNRPDYSTYKSPYGPSYKHVPNVHGIGPKQLGRFAFTAGSFGAVAGFFALYFFSDVPRVRKDIFQKLPVIGDYFVHEIPPSDNPF